MVFLPFVYKHFVLLPLIQGCHLPVFVMTDSVKIIRIFICAANFGSAVSPSNMIPVVAMVEKAFLLQSLFLKLFLTMTQKPKLNIYNHSLYCRTKKSI